MISVPLHKWLGGLNEASCCILAHLAQRTSILGHFLGQSPDIVCYPSVIVSVTLYVLSLDGIECLHLCVYWS